MNIDSEAMQTEFLNIWESKVASFPQATLFDLDKYLKGSFSVANSQASELIPKHLFLLSLATSCLLLLTRFVGERKMSTRSAAFISQLHRSVNCLIAIRLLLTSGLEETCRPITRNYLEILDISVACLGDHEFAIQLFGDDGVDFDSLWKSSIGFGKVYQYIRKAFQLAGLSDDEAAEHIQYRKAQKTLLSSSVHGDDAGAFRSMVIPLLGYPDMLSMEPHGVVSVHTANHVAAVISETFKHISLVLKILISKSAPAEFDLPREGVNMHTFFAHFFSFQEIYFQHELPDGDDIIASDFSTIHS
ncbi:hypothetical protein LZ012_13365 [Dechloromonas sp. XY25]|uniref:Uncharacterized protein n=1 Tax=Dechloromonas hankyongensis TaxID=2908002 RepID=A0ABS9K483_9RHOO|nr:hypothetical protein [Dechloromonas hankyongensis]MCG2577979.1 hypothetical protein [Dechloromonas hankyongensis]